MTTVSPERDRVVLAIVPRGQDLLVTPDQARRLAEAMRTTARDCQLWVEAGGPPELVRGEERGASVVSRDGQVVLRLATPTDRESIPYKAALTIADLLERRATEAEIRLSIVWTPNRRKS